MARKPQVNYWPKRGGYYTQMKGLQRRLATGPDDRPDGPTYEAALAAYRRLLEDERAEQNGACHRIGLVIGRYMEFVERHRSKSTVTTRDSTFAPFVRMHGEQKIHELNEDFIQGFLDVMRARGGRFEALRRRKWGDTACAGFIAALQAALNWAARKSVRLIPENPLKGMEKPPMRSRGREALITPEQHGKLLAVARPTVRDILVCLEATGCRPGELLGSTAADWNEEQGAITLHRELTRRRNEASHKSGRSKERHILFWGESLEIMRRRIRRHPVGPLFWTQARKPYTVGDLAKWLRRWRVRIDAPALIPYAYRHTLATNWLRAGKSVEKLAAILGNTPGVIHQHYAHLLEHTRELRVELESFMTDRSASASPALPYRVVG